jgi:hypothetical protein
MTYFVYELIDPRCGSVFYVGKGKGRRPYQHRVDAIRGVPGRKCERIRAILASEAEPVVRIVKRFTDEHEAYAEEVFHIASIGIDNLTNVCIGGVGAMTRPDTTKDARKAILGGLVSVRKALVADFADIQLSVCGQDITLAVKAFVDDMRRKAGAEWFDEIVGVPKWQPV